MTKKMKKVLAKNLEKARAALAAKRAADAAKAKHAHAVISEATSTVRAIEAREQVEQAQKTISWIATPVNDGTLLAVEKALQSALQQVQALRGSMKELL